MEQLKLLITVKTYPIPSAKYDELVCTAGVTELGDFVRLYPIRFRDLPYSQQYRKYQWIEVAAQKHSGSDTRKESYRPDCTTLKAIGEPIPTHNGAWSERARYALAKAARSLEELRERQRVDRTSLGVFRPKIIHDLLVSKDTPEWKRSFIEALRRERLWDDRHVTKQPPRKVPFKFHYHFECDDNRCTRPHKMMIEDWEVGALDWKLVDRGATPEEAASKVRDKFLGELCGSARNTHFFVGTIKDHPTKWVVVGLFYPKVASTSPDR